ncbi:DUF6892 domain-containing protein [Aquimarina mytili]|uniref:DUF6892 domain-containing protein n=1 Tax=Aquimarina mytili TaxID=874423 RepID=A0A936ZRU9_9FLAO|nr:hypothetical protein [Aquimarina mytili]MBL0684257.1 hypothetical protein [Aquimarina mytili]
MEPITFTDFNFKLAVIQVLMYEKELIKPKFDLYEFVKQHQAREINIEDEGYDFIPEVTAYFENLKIDKNLATEVTEIYQDGGNEIYLELIRFWDGEDAAFDITSAKDAKQFPNLKRVTLFDASPELEDEFKNLGIEVEYL